MSKTDTYIQTLQRLMTLDRRLMEHDWATKTALCKVYREIEPFPSQCEISNRCDNCAFNHMYSLSKTVQLIESNRDVS